MKKKIATMLRKEAEKETIGMGTDITRGAYLVKKRKYKEEHNPVVNPKIKLSKRAARLKAA